MTRRKTVAVAWGVLLAGVCGALPFRRPHPQHDAPPGAAARGDLILSQPVQGGRGTPPPAEPAAPAAAPTNASLELAASYANPQPPTTAPAAPTNLESLAQSEAPPAEAAVLSPTPGDAAPSRPHRTWRLHRIRDGDTLAKLAQRYFGDPAREEEIFALNRDVLADPAVLPIGRWLRIPAEDAAPE